MPELHVRNIPPEVHEALRERAASEGRSMSSEAVVLLRQALTSAGDASDRRRSAIERLREIRERNRLPAGAPTAEELVAEDRERAG